MAPGKGVIIGDSVAISDPELKRIDVQVKDEVSKQPTSFKGEKHFHGKKIEMKLRIIWNFQNGLFSTDETLVSHPSPEMIHLYSVIILLPLHPSLLLVTRRIHFPWNRVSSFFKSNLNKAFLFDLFLQTSTFGNATNILHTEKWQK